MVLQAMYGGERAQRHAQYGEMRLLFIPWHAMTLSFSLPFADDAKKASFQRTLKPDELDLKKRFPHITLEQFAWRRMILAGPVFNLDEEKFDEKYPTDLATAFLTAGSSVFTRPVIKRLRRRYPRTDLGRRRLLGRQER